MLQRFTSSIYRVIATLVSIGILIAIPVYATLFSSKTATPTTQYSTAPATVKDLSTTITASGTATLEDEQTLRFNQAGTVTAVFVTEGQRVTRGTTLAQLDNDDLQNTIAKSRIEVENARLALTLSQHTTEASTIEKSRNAVSVAETTLNNSQAEYDLLLTKEHNALIDAAEAITRAQAAVDLKKNAVTLAQQAVASETLYAADDSSALTRAHQQTLTDAAAAYTTCYNAADDILFDLNSILGIDEGTVTNNDTFEKYLGTLDGGTESRARNAYSTAYTAFSILPQNPSTSSRDTLLTHLTQAQHVIQTLIDAADATRAYAAASVANASFSQSTLDSLVTSASNARTTANTWHTTLQSSIDALNNLSSEAVLSQQQADTLASKEQALTAAQHDLTQAEDTLKSATRTRTTTIADYTLQKEKLTATIAANQQSLTTAELSLTETLRGEKAETLTQKKNAVTAAELSLAAAEKKQENYQITAPFDGVVTGIDFKTGDKILADEQKYIYLQNPDLVTIEVLLDQIDAVKVSQGQQASIIFDAFPETPITGTVLKISSTPTISSGVVSFETTLLPTLGTLTIRSGMTASITITAAARSQVLTVPALAITTEGATSFVRILENNTPKKITVTTGLTDNATTEITSGLTAGQEVITFERTTAQNTEQKNTSLIPTPGAGTGTGARNSGGGDSGPPPM